MFVSERGAELLGRRREDLIGGTYEDAFPDAAGTSFDTAYRRVMRERTPLVVEDRYEPWDRWFENRIFPLGQGIGIVFTDVTERKHAEAELRRAADRLRALHEMDTAILAGRPPDEVAAIAIRHLGHLVPYDRANVALLDEEGDTATVLAVSGDDLGFPKGTVLRLVDFPSVIGVLRSGAPEIVDLDHVEPSRGNDLLRSAGFRHALLAPLRPVTGQAIGFLGIARHSTRSAAQGGFDPVEVGMVDDLMTQLAIALRQARLDQERIAAELQRARLAAAIEQSPESVVVTDLDGRIEYVNPAFERTTGYSREEAIGRNPSILKSGHESPAFYEAMWTTLRSGGVWSADIVNRRKDGSLYTDYSIISPVHDEAGAITSYVSVQRDVTAEREAEARETRRARERALIAEALSAIRPRDTPEQSADAICGQVVQLPEVTMASLLLFEPDGSALPLALAVKDGRTLERLRLTPERSQQLRTQAALGPWVEAWRVRPGHPYLEDHLALGLRGQAYAPVRSGSELTGLLTVGSAEPDAVPLLTERLPALLQFAALAGALLSPAVAARNAAAQARSGLRAVIDEGAFHPEFQPIVDLGSGVVVGYEALTRFADGARPDLRFEEANAAGLGLELETATLRASVAASTALPRWTWLNLNVSPGMLLATDRLRDILGPLLKPAGRRAVLELTEHQPIADYRTLLRAVGRLGPHVDIAVDDAGAGFASLRHILELRPRYVKLDHGLVHRVDRDPARQALIAGMVHFALQVQCTLIGEGVETEGERRTLLTLGVRSAQGYLLGRPDRIDRLDLPRHPGGRSRAHPGPTG